MLYSSLRSYERMQACASPCAGEALTKHIMLIHQNKKFSIFFGDQQTAFNRHQFYDANIDSQTFAQNPPFDSILPKLGITNLIALKQTHSTVGYFIAANNITNFAPYQHEGDFLVTNIPHIGLGVATGDCLPIIVYDKKNHAAGIAHAGWKGALNGVIQNMLKLMQQEFKSQPLDLEAFLGPSGLTCCYEVQNDFLEQLLPEYVSYTIIKRANKIYFDLPAFAKVILKKNGLTDSAINIDYVACTICTINYCSNRRDKENSKRQMTIVCLKR